VWETESAKQKERLESHSTGHFLSMVASIYYVVCFTP
jgi:hypothetical protein